MALNYTPATMRGGSSVLPYSFEPPVAGAENVSKVNTFSFARSIAPFVNTLTVFIAIAAYTLISVLVAGNIDNLGYMLLFAVLGAFFSALAVRGSIPTLAISALIGVPVLFNNTFGFAPVTLMLILILSLVVGFKKRFSRGSAARSISNSAEMLADLKESMIPVWGVPGAHIGSNTEFGDAARVGAEGEVIVGQALEKIARKFPHVRVFHSVCFTPGRKGADVDHVVLIGDDVFLIDAKNWTAGTYSWGRNEVLRDGSPFKGGSVKMNVALEKWQAYLGRSASRVSAMVCMVNNRKGKYNVPDTLYGGVRLTTLNQLVAILTEAAKNSEPVVDRGLVYSVAVQLQN